MQTKMRTELQLASAICVSLHLHIFCSVNPSPDMHEADRGQEGWTEQTWGMLNWLMHALIYNYITVGKLLRRH